MRTNKAIAALERQPCTVAELPYKICTHKMSIANRERLQQIRVAGRKTHSCHRCGKFKTIYYLLGDEDRAVGRFIEVNKATLARLNLHANCALDSGLSRDMAQRIRGAMKDGHSAKTAYLI